MLTQQPKAGQDLIETIQGTNLMSPVFHQKQDEGKDAGLAPAIHNQQAQRIIPYTSHNPVRNAAKLGASP